jgi:hypothetical protein
MVPYTLNTTIANAAQTHYITYHFPAVVCLFSFYMINRGSLQTILYPLTSITSDTLDNAKTANHFVVLQNATVINGQVQLNWLPAPSTEVSAYLVYNDRDGFTTPDTVAGRLNTTYLDVVNDPDLFAIRYKVRALEFCEDPAGLQGAITPDSADHRNRSYASWCTGTNARKPAIFSWQSYKIGGAQVVSYEVQQSINRGAYTIAGVQPGTSNSFFTAEYSVQRHRFVCV